MAEYAILCRWLHRLHLGLSAHMVPRNPWLSFPRGWICCLIIMFAINVYIYIILYILYIISILYAFIFLMVDSIFRHSHFRGIFPGPSNQWRRPSRWTWALSICLHRPWRFLEVDSRRDWTSTWHMAKGLVTLEGSEQRLLSNGEPVGARNWVSNHLIVAESLCFFFHFSSFPNGKSSRNREFVPGIFCVIRHNCWFCGGRLRGRWRGVFHQN